MGLLGKIFGSSKAIDKISKGVDAVVFTPEEKAAHFLDLLKSYEPFKLAQRLIAIAVVTPYVIVWLLCAIMFALSLFFEPCETICKATQLKDISDGLAQRNNDTLGLPVSLVLGFYFGGGAVEGVVKRFKK